jgi:hypothetical protein
MQQKITIDNVFKKEITRSIINLLNKFEGLRPLQIQYALDYNYRKKIQAKKDNKQNNNEDIEDLEHKHNIRECKELFGEKLNKLYYYKIISKDCVNNWYQLKYNLKQLVKEEIIYKIGENKSVRYHIAKELKNKIIKIDDINSKKFYSNYNLMHFPIRDYFGSEEYIKSGQIIYGLSDKIFLKFNQNDRDYIKKELKRNLELIDFIDRKKFELYIAKGKKRIKNFQKSLKSKKLKEFLDKNYDLVIGMIYNNYSFAKNKEFKEFMDITKSKRAFYQSYGFFWPIDDLKKYNMKNPAGPITLNVELAKFYGFGKYSSRKIDSEEIEISNFCKIWCLTYLGKDYKLKINEIKKLIDWGWRNRDFYKEFWPLGISYSHYHKIFTREIEKYILT